MTDLLAPLPTQEIIPVELVEKAKSYARASKSDSTIRTYASAWRSFAVWCDIHGVISLPATTETIIAFVVEQADRLRPVTIQKVLTAISQAHRLAGHPSPTFSEPVKLVMQGIRRTKGVAGTPKRALRVEHIKKMVLEMPDTLMGLRDKAIVLLGFVGGMRRSEIVALDLEDVTFEPEGAIVTIRKSKRDQEGKGRRVAVPRGRLLGPTCSEVIPAFLDHVC